MIVLCACRRAHVFDAREGSLQTRRCPCERIVTCRFSVRKSRWEWLEVD